MNKNFKHTQQSVKLISTTTPSIEGVKSVEDVVVYCARVSNPSNQLNMETAPRLLNFLIKHKHWSPFEMVDLTYEITTSRGIAAQILRHRSFSFQEFSQRYSAVNEAIEPELRLQAESNRQSSVDIIDDEVLLNKVDEVYDLAFKTYNELIDEHGVARESARGLLPLNTKTTLYMKGSLRSWLGYLNVRLEENTQKEHREIAQMIATNLLELCPNTYQATDRFGSMTGDFM